jgi:hypothetical protein
MKTLQATLVAALTLVSTATFAQPVPPPPPAPPAYIGPPAPGPHYGLEPGHYAWNGVSYVWVPQRWYPWRAGFARYVPGHLNRFGVWVPGHWAR